MLSVWRSKAGITFYREVLHAFAFVGVENFPLRLLQKKGSETSTERIQFGKVVWASGHGVKSSSSRRNKMATSTVTVTVNGKPVEQYLAAEKSKEVTDFLRNELRGLRRGIRGAR
jgi:hypothetical protein